MMAACCVKRAFAAPVSFSVGRLCLAEAPMPVGRDALAFVITGYCAGLRLGGSGKGNPSRVHENRAG